VTITATARLRPPWTATRVGLVVIPAAFALATVWSWRHVGMSLTTVFAGIGDIANLLERMLPPRFVDLPRILDLAIQTFFMAYLGTVIASLLSTPLAFLAAANTTPHPVVRGVARGIIAVCRAVPDIVFALVFVRAVGIGPLPGVLAISLHSIGMVGKLYADAVEQCDELPREATLSTGASRLQTLTTAVVPQVLPSFVGASLYRLDINLRTSVILGLVGAGGIGFELQAALRQLVYDRGLGIVVVIAIMVIVVEFASAAIRRSIIGEDAFTAAKSPRPWRRPRSRPIRAAATEGTNRSVNARVTPPWTGERVLRFAYLGSGVALAGGAFLFVDLSPLELMTNLPDVVATGAKLFPPDFGTATDTMRQGVLETLAIAVVATVLGVAMTIPLGLLSARNLAPSRPVYLVARAVVVVIRSVPELVLAIVFVSAIGLGPVPGVLALAVGTVGFMGKLLADGIEEIDPAPREAVLATGASRLQETATSVVPQAMPSFVANALYMLDINIRTSTILGIVGAGGIGFLLNNSVRTLHLHTTSAIIIVLLAVVYAIELLSNWIRRRII
jgi:phosphonate transport system permease protein